MQPGEGNERWEVAYRNWQRLANAGYVGKRAVHYTTLQKQDDRIRKAKEKYERLLKEFKAKNHST